MNLSEILEDETKGLVIIYPGRFHPFHIGHGKVYKYLKQKYPNAQVFISTSGKVDGDRSPFTFEEKKKMMILAGVDSGAIVQCKSPYQSIEIVQRFDEDKTVVVFAVSEKDMAEEPRFDFSGGIKLKKNGEPAYMQKWTGLDSAETYRKHGYLATTPTFPFEVLGQEINSASQIRNMITASDDTKLSQILQDLYNITDVPNDIIEIFKRKIGNKETMNENWSEYSLSEFLIEIEHEEKTMKNGILQTITEGYGPMTWDRMKSIAADMKDYVDDHKEHFDAYPQDVEIDDKIYDWDEYWGILDKVYPDAYDNQYANESIDEEFDRKVKEIVEAKFSIKEESGQEDLDWSLFIDYVGNFYGTNGIYADFFKNDDGSEGVSKKEIVKTVKALLKDETWEWGSGDTMDREKVRDMMLTAREDDKNFESIKEGDYANEQHEQLEYIHHVLQECGDGNVDNAMVDQAIAFVEDIREQHFNTDGSTKSESRVRESQGYQDLGNIEGYLDTIDEYVEKLFIKDAGHAQPGSTSIKEIAYRIQNAVDDIRTRELELKPSLIRAKYNEEDHKVDEWVQDQDAGNWSMWTAQERSFIQELCLRHDGIKMDPAGLKYLGKSELWDEGSILKDKGKLTTLMLWVKKNKDDIEGRFTRMFKVYSKDNNNGQSDGNQVLQNIIGKIGSVKVEESEERPYICVHAKKGKYETHATSSYDAAKNAAKHWGLKSTAGIDAHLADVEHVAEELDDDALIQIVESNGIGDLIVLDEDGKLVNRNELLEIAPVLIPALAALARVGTAVYKYGKPTYKAVAKKVGKWADDIDNYYARPQPSPNMSKAERLANYGPNTTKFSKELIQQQKQFQKNLRNGIKNEGEEAIDLGLGRRHKTDVLKSRIPRYSYDGIPVNSKGELGYDDAEVSNWKDLYPNDYDDRIQRIARRRKIKEWLKEDAQAEEKVSTLTKMQTVYKHNEDRNNHSENILMLAQAFGDRGEIKAIEGLLKTTKQQGYVTPEQSEVMYNSIHKKYYKELFPLNELWPALAVAGAAGYGLYKGGKAIGKWMANKTKQVGKYAKATQDVAKTTVPESIANEIMTKATEQSIDEDDSWKLGPHGTAGKRTAQMKAQAQDDSWKLTGTDAMRDLWYGPKKPKSVAKGTGKHGPANRYARANTGPGDKTHLKKREIEEGPGDKTQLKKRAAKQALAKQTARDSGDFPHDSPEYRVLMHKSQQAGVRAATDNRSDRKGVVATAKAVAQQNAVKKANKQNKAADAKLVSTPPFTKTVAKGTGAKGPAGGATAPVSTVAKPGRVKMKIKKSDLFGKGSSKSTKPSDNTIDWNLGYDDEFGSKPVTGREKILKINKKKTNIPRDDIFKGADLGHKGNWVESILHYSDAKGTPKYKEGYKAARKGVKYDENPYSGAEKLQWSKGHNDFRADKLRAAGEPNYGARGQFENKR